jgi:hypothetical protein
MKLYVLVRADLEWQHRSVQAGHAVAEFLLEHPETKWNNGTLIYLKVKDQEDLLDWCDRFVEYAYTPWFEHDRGNQLTAIAVTGVDDLVKELPLL